VVAVVPEVSVDGLEALVAPQARRANNASPRRGRMNFGPEALMVSPDDVL
jgi:hypothetical protein